MCDDNVAADLRSDVEQKILNNRRLHYATHAVYVNFAVRFTAVVIIQK